MHSSRSTRCNYDPCRVSAFYREYVFQIYEYSLLAAPPPPCISPSIAGTRGGLTRISSSPPFFSSSRRNPSFHKRIFERIERTAPDILISEKCVRRSFLPDYFHIQECFLVEEITAAALLSRPLSFIAVSNGYPVGAILNRD